jgi:FAD synthetase
MINHKLKKVLVFGTFDLLHDGHKYFLEESKKLGDKLFVVVARDKTVGQIKGIIPKQNESERLKNVEKTGIADKVLPGSNSNYYSVLSEIKPDIICLGYDQRAFVNNLDEELESRGLKTNIIRIKSHKPEVFKSSILRKR